MNNIETKLKALDIIIAKNVRVRMLTMYCKIIADSHQAFMRYNYEISTIYKQSETLTKDEFEILREVLCNG